MNEIVNECKGFDVGKKPLYTDTDSLLINYEQFKTLENKGFIESNTLGKSKCEDIISEWICVGKKAYLSYGMEYSDYCKNPKDYDTKQDYHYAFKGVRITDVFKEKYNVPQMFKDLKDNAHDVNYSISVDNML